MDTVTDFEDLLELLERHEVQYLIVGGMAFIFHAKPRYTKDMDLWIGPWPDNVARTNRALADFGSPHLLDPQRPEEILQILLDEDVDVDDLPEWQREWLPKVREATESDGWLALPDKFDVHDWGIMERFCLQAAADHRDELLDTIHGRGAFRMFRSRIQRLGLEQDWYAFKDAEYERIAREWLEAHGLAYEAPPPRNTSS